MKDYFFMKQKIINTLKIVLPLGFGVFLIWLFYDALCEDDKKELFKAFGRANYFWVIISLFCGFASHLSRAWRWRYMLDSLGYKVKFWNAYHSVMIGYIINYILPRAGEASRAGVLAKTEKVPFQKGFGSIIAERAIDVGMLAIITLVAVFMQYDMLEDFNVKIDGFTSGESGCGNSFIFSLLGKIVVYGFLLIVLAGFIYGIVNKSFRKKLVSFFKGVIEGGLSVFRMKKKGYFIVHTLFIWLMYVTMFSICFFTLESTSHLGIDAWLAGFVAGTVGFIIVQGGIGVYPAFVGLIITTYINADAPGILPDALALGWIMWASQTIMVIVLGLVSLVLNGKNVKFDHDQSSATSAENTTTN